MKKAIMFIMFYVWLIILVIVVRIQEVEIKQLEHKIYVLSIQVENSEARCQRMTDTCIDIIANRRWENGE